jgi:serine/threonine-protein kinase
LDVDGEGEIKGVLGWLHVAGERIVGRYEVDSILGKGGFGATYLVKDKSLFDKPLVLKEVPERFEVDPRNVLLSEPSIVSRDAIPRV